MCAGDAGGPWEPATESVILAAQYDCYVLNANPRERILPEKARARVFSYGRGRFEGAAALNVLLIRGQVAGIWQPKTCRGRVEIRVESFGHLTSARRARLESEAARIGSFYGREAKLVLGPLDG